jgi:hypothetical protein
VATNQQKRPAIRMELEKPAGGENVEVSFLARGITWVPSYRIDLSDEKTAHFSAQAQIINELADIQDAHVDLVTGFPNIQFPELPNPVAMSQNVAEVLDKSDSAQDVQTARGLKQVNPKHVLTWTLELKPDEECTITYSYPLYVRP